MKIIGNWRVLPPSIRKIVRVMKISVFLVLVCTLQLSASVMLGQQVNLQSGEMSVREVFKELKAQTGTYFMFSEKEVDESLTVNANFSQVSLKEALDEMCKQTSLKYEIIDDYVLITKRPRVIEQKQEEKKELRGKVTDEKGEPLPGASVVVKETTIGVSTNLDGEFKLKIPNSGKVIILISSIGYKTKEIKVGDKLDFKVKLEPDTEVMSEVVVTGYFKKAKESFTGTVVSVKAEELETLGSVDVISALQTFDPSFKIVDNSLMGSDPNSMPNIQIRGQANFPGISETELKGTTNMPTFILNGFEVSAEAVFDLDMNNIASISILKDASATAIYGSRAANGVVVIEEKKPAAGKIRVTYNADVEVSIADLSDYNLLKAEEKLEVERLGGLYSSSTPSINNVLQNRYYELLRDVKSGVDTDWLAQPVRNAVGHKHFFNLQGGDEFFRYGLDFGYHSKKGVMKGSGRDRYNIGVFLQYRHKDIVFKNKLSVSQVEKEESPYGSFSTYTKLNPYYKIKDDQGHLIKVLGYNPEDQFARNPRRQYNPLYDAEETDGFNRGKYTQIINNFSIDWDLIDALKVKANLSISKNIRKDEVYVSPNSTRFDHFKEEDVFERGEYSIDDSELLSYESNVMLSYFKELDDHVINTVLGGEISNVKNLSEGYTATGFVNDKLDHISFAKRYAKDTNPRGSESLSRLIGSFFNVNYTYKTKYLFDASLRIDGSSKFGSKQQTAPFWSLGVGWNIHKENFLKDNTVVNNLKLTANTGISGSQNFNAYNAITTYRYYDNLRYHNLTGAKIMALGNEDLKWQSTRNTNISLELGLFNDRVSLKSSYYNKTTYDLLTQFTTAPSVGFDSYYGNKGDVENKGIEVNLRVMPIRTKDLTLSLYGNLVHNKNKIKKISGSLKAYNDKLLEAMREELEIDGDYEKNIDYKDRKTVGTITQFVEGKSLNTIYTVRSLGIDPATGREIYLDKDGKRTYTWNPEDIVDVGETTPKFEGYFGGDVSYKALHLSVSFNYSYGGKIMNHTIMDKVENADIYDNADKRVLTQRWLKPGDMSYYKDIKSSAITRSSTRFIEDNNYLALNNISLSYSIDNETTKKMGLSRLKFTAGMRDVFRLSSVKQERGLAYPFARTMNFSVKMNF